MASDQQFIAPVPEPLPTAALAPPKPPLEVPDFLEDEIALRSRSESKPAAAKETSHS